MIKGRKEKEHNLLSTHCVLAHTCACTHFSFFFSYSPLNTLQGAHTDLSITDEGAGPVRGRSLPALVQRLGRAVRVAIRSHWTALHSAHRAAGTAPGDWVFDLLTVGPPEDVTLFGHDGDLQGRDCMGFPWKLGFKLYFKKTT